MTTSVVLSPSEVMQHCMFLTSDRLQCVRHKSDKHEILEPTPTADLEPNLELVDIPKLKIQAGKACRALFGNMPPRENAHHEACCSHREFSHLPFILQWKDE